MAPEDGGVPDTICALPWLNLSLDVNGSSRPCCRFAQPDPESRYQLANLRDTDLEGVWNSEAMQLLRRDFRAGARPAECATCWDEEAAGIPSWRMTFTSDRGVNTVPDYDDLTPAQPAALDLKLSNACNLKCRICGPTASSLWLQEEVQHGSPEVADGLRAERSYLKSNKITGQAANAATFDRWVAHLDHVEMTGGEPMYSSENREVLKAIDERGDAARTSLHITTNATVVDDRMLALLPRFGHVTVTLSIDDVGPRHTYERSPGRWEDVEANLARYHALVSPSFHVLINCSVSTLNVWYLPEMVDWWRRAVPDLRVPLYLNLVHSPAHYDTRNLPLPLKAKVTERLHRAADDTACPAHLRQELRSVADFLNGTAPDADRWQDLLVATAERDRIREESFAATFPELWAEIEALGLGPAEAPARETAVRVLARRLLRR